MQSLGCCLFLSFPLDCVTLLVLELSVFDALLLCCLPDSRCFGVVAVVGAAVGMTAPDFALCCNCRMLTEDC